MERDIEGEAALLTGRFGAQALAEAQALLEAATAARDYKAAIFYAEVCRRLSGDA